VVNPTAARDIGNCFPFLHDEAYLSHLIRVANFKVVSVESVIEKRQFELRNLRDFGFGVAGYCRFLKINDAARVRRERTLLPYFLFDRTNCSGFGDAILATMMRGFRREGARLRMCAHCLEAEQARWGFGIWHLSHQLPCTVVCGSHGEILNSVTFGNRPLRLPEPRDWQPPSFPVTPFLRVLANADFEIFGNCTSPQRRERLVNCLRSAAFRPGDGRLSALDRAARIRHLIPGQLLTDLGIAPFLDPYLEQFVREGQIDNTTLALLYASLLIE
jgi:hypothetical protein